MSSSRFLTGCCEKNPHRGENWGKREKFALASGEEANNIGRKLARSTVRIGLLVLILFFGGSARFLGL